MPLITRRHAALAAASTLATLTTAHRALAQADAWKVAIVSLIGDELNVVRYRGETGTQLAPTFTETYANPDPQFDNLAMATATKALRERHPTARVSEVAPPKAGSDADPARLLSGGKPAADNPVYGALKSGGFTHLLLVAKHRAQAQLQFRSGRSGAGQLAGLGFYIDNELRVASADGSNPTQGYIAPFAYFRATWIDLARLAVLAEESVTATYTITAARREGTDPWSALEPERKIEALRSLVGRNMSEVMPKLLAAR